MLRTRREIALAAGKASAAAARTRRFHKHVEAIKAEPKGLAFADQVTMAEVLHGLGWDVRGDERPF